MDSQLINIGKKLVVLTLIMGFLAMPVAPILAEETLAPVTPIVNVPSDSNLSEVLIVPDVVSSSSDAIVTPSVPVVDVIATSSVEVSTFASDTLPVIDIASDSPELSPDQSTPSLDQKVATFDQPGEDNFITKSDDSTDDQNLVASDELSFITLATDEEIANLAVSAEGSFTTTTAPVNNGEIAVSEENSFTTTTLPHEDNVTVSAEQSFNTLGAPTTDLVVSAEQDFTTLGLPNNDVVVSEENSFTTLPGGDHTDPVVSEENSFTTLGTPTDNNVSEEMSFTTLGGSGNPDDGENSFTTLSNSGGCVTNCGGGGGGGGGYILGENTYRCEVLITKFIRLGQLNDRREVIKLQAFLKVYEGFKNLNITGIYDMPTYRAVEIFQKRYNKDVLGPWGLADSTGYVYITTRLAINNIFCGRDTTNNTDLRDEFYRQYQEATGETFYPSAPTTIATSTDTGYYLDATTTEVSFTTPHLKRSWILASLSGLFGFVGDNLCWLLNLLLLLIIFFLLWLLWLAGLSDEDDSSAAQAGDATSVDVLGLPTDKIEEVNALNEPIVNSSLGMVGAIALEELMTEDDQVALADLAEEEDSQIPAANNDPDQETLLDK